MDAELVARQKIELDEHMRVEIVVWLVPVPVRGSVHLFKYRLALIYKGLCVMRYDNEAGKGDHKHLGEMEVRYAFQTLDQLRQDFWADVALIQLGRDE